MSENLNVYPNAKSPLVGADTHAAELTGSVVSNLDTTVSVPIVSAGSCSGGQGDWQTIATINLTMDEVANELFLYTHARFSLSSSNAMEVRLVRDGDTDNPIASTNTGVTTGGSWTLSTTIFNETVAAHTYIWQIRNTVNPGETSCVYNVVTYYIRSQATDTHTADLTGANTQTTHEQGVLPV